MGRGRLDGDRLITDYYDKQPLSMDEYTNKMWNHPI